MSNGQPSVYSLEGRDWSQVTRSEIIEAIKVAPQVSSSPESPPLARISKTAIVKYGHRIHPYEARTMQHITKHTTIRSPAVLDAWEETSNPDNEDTRIGYIVMDFIEGDLLHEVWDTSDAAGQQTLLQQLHGYMQQLHSLEFDTPGPLGGGKSEGMFFIDYGAGPFKSTSDLEDFYNFQLATCHNFGHAKDLLPGHFSGRFKDLVMCHLDIHDRNLMLDKQGKLWMLDWGWAGAYPKFVEYATLRWANRRDVTRDLVELLEGDVGEDTTNLLKMRFAFTTGALEFGQLSGAGDMRKRNNERINDESVYPESIGAHWRVEGT